MHFLTTMKHLLLATLFLTAGFFAFGQCGTKVVLTSSQTQHLGPDRSIQRTEDEKTVIEFDKSTITIEGKDGRIVLLAELNDTPDDRIQLIADKFEEKKDQK